MKLFKRLFSPWFKKISPSERQLLETHLNPAGQFLFSQMSRMDQYHALEVMRTILTEAAKTPGLKVGFLVQAALLHDAGKVRGDFNLFSRVLVALVRRLNPTWRGKFTFTNPHNFWQKVGYSFYVDLVHPARGAHMAKVLGIGPLVVDLIRRHHDPPYPGQSPELTWLQKADSRN